VRIISSDRFHKRGKIFINNSDVKIVKKIIEDVRSNGDRALIKYTRKYDRVNLTIDSLRVPDDVIKNSLKNFEEDLRDAIETARRNIEKFSLSQLKHIKDFTVETSRGVYCSQKVIPIKRVGIYIPAGNFPLVSTLLMCAVPAIVAGVSEIVVFSPPRTGSDIHPLILKTAALLGIREIYRVGGVQAIAAMAYGTESIMPVDKIVGPGNKYVSIAKKEVYGIAGIDMIAGPSEVVIIADKYARAPLVAADMIAQAEHDINASSILLTDSISLAREVKSELQRQTAKNPNQAIIKESLKKNGYIVYCRDLNECVEIANRLAPEHLELVVKDEKGLVNRLVNYGSLFVGEYSAEVFGDYSAGVNHTLPTGGVSRYRGGLSVFDFVKITTVLRMNKDGYKTLKDCTLTLSSLEGLKGHYNAVRIRDD
jgi:histidinol dehydrogenase